MKKLFTLLTLFLFAAVQAQEISETNLPKEGYETEVVYVEAHVEIITDGFIFVISQNRDLSYRLKNDRDYIEGVQYSFFLKVLAGTEKKTTRDAVVLYHTKSPRQVYKEIRGKKQEYGL